MNEGHQRFQDWLTAGAEGDPPRDAAVHASVCDTCRQSTAALDQLAAVDPGRAPMPTALPAGGRQELANGARWAGVAAAVLFGAVLLGVGASQLIGLTRGNGPIAQASQTPDQGVLGGTATARPSAGEASLSPGQSLEASGPASPTTRPITGATARPRRTATPTATSAASSTSGPTPGGTPTGIPTPTVAATPTPSPTPTPTPTPTPIPTPAPTAPGAPTLVSAVAVSSSAVDLGWVAGDDGGSAITNYRIYRDGELIDTVGDVTSYTDATVSSGTTYSYQVAAINVVGEGPLSNPLDVTTP